MQEGHNWKTLCAVRSGNLALQGRNFSPENISAFRILISTLTDEFQHISTKYKINTSK